MCIYSEHMDTKYEVSMSNPMARRCAQTMLTPTTTHDGQSMIVYGSLVDKPNEPKTKDR